MPIRAGLLGRAAAGRRQFRAGRGGDVAVSCGHGQNTAARVPGAQLVSYERGGHLLSLQIDDASEKVTAFVRQHTAGPASDEHGVTAAVRR